MARLVAEKETGTFIALGVLAYFLLFNYDSNMGAAYFGLAIFNIVLYQNYNHWKLRFNKGQKLVESIVIALMAYGAFLAISSVLGAVGMNSFSLNSMFGLMSQTVPALSNSFLLTLLGFGLVVAILETDFFFGRLLELGANKLNISTKFDLKNPNLWMLILLISGIFSGFHISAKIIELNIGLLFTFLFAVISCWIVIYTRRTAEASKFHILTNSAYVLYRFGYLAVLFPTIFNAL